MKNSHLIIVGIITAILLAVSLAFFGFKTVNGNELGVLETWNGGVSNDILQPKTHILFPSFSQTVFTYNVGLQAYDLSSYTIRSADNQDMEIKAKVQWRRDPSKLVIHHKTFKASSVEEVAIKPTMLSAILRHGTQYKALDAYSGEGLIKMQVDIGKDLINSPQLAMHGIIVETFIIESVHLKAEYLETINARQLATLRQSKAVEEQKAAEAEALVAKSKAQADLNRAVVEAQRDKEVKVLAAEADKQRQILESSAIKEKLILEADGKKQANIAEAEGLLALGKSKAESQKLWLETFAVNGANGFIQIEVAKQVAEGFKNIQGYLPANMSVNLLTENFLGSIGNLLGSKTK